MTKRHGGGVTLVLSEGRETNRQVFQAYSVDGKEDGLEVPVRIDRPTLKDPRRRVRMTPIFGTQNSRRISKIAKPSTDESYALKSVQAAAQATADQVQLYDRLVDVDVGPFQSPTVTELANVAEAMTSGGFVEPQQSTEIPAVMTYFGQFLAHDVTHLQWSTPESAWTNLRAGHSLDFGTVLTQTDLSHPQNSNWNCHAGVSLGETTTTGEHRDLPRSLLPYGQSCTSDARNDTNLALAQIIVLLTRFLHAVRQHNPTLSVEQVGALTAQHLQAVVLDDYLRTICDPGIWQDIRDNGRSLVWTDKTRPFYVPIEFAAAGFRFGHSMVRDMYAHWGDSDKFMCATTFLRFVHDPPDPANSLINGRLGGIWAHDWRAFSRLADAGDMVRAARIDPNIAFAFRDLSEGHFALKTAPQAGATINLAHHTLKRQYTLGLPTGQQLAQLAGVPTMSAAEVLGTGYSNIADAIDQAGFGSDTPLWFYILREAEFFQGGGRLGPLGSRLVCETLHAAIENSAASILTETGGPAPEVSFVPTMPRVTNGGLYKIEDVIALAYPAP
ncbi:hypothetical protein [Phaeobacter gallaeciensis]|uniref:hypothetical protein n=1 Tax=Phaeobacter gallaeciensis TaxID=60890 RepID=UPI00237F82AD|nr:hypothetical protein [Phaeobacter gallaeciensis]MDE4100067.1 hypothetical protein [Phaeobacter gallaeciensis]MDE4108892.1 hypothetical protein [Phaeobacter gallaeciensis]MDE4113338.1 hypothetical protein [Phaeobacter gallaeciensis]MDE4117752.1 hypothetical protein [Phaeobacter gallaeciensis]MDE4122255.1 hypothetical protein [Phaeobacter gallaeciensis]